MYQWSKGNKWIINWIINERIDMNYGEILKQASNDVILKNMEKKDSDLCSPINTTSSSSLAMWFYPQKNLSYKWGLHCMLWFRLEKDQN